MFSAKSRYNKGGNLFFKEKFDIIREKYGVPWPAKESEPRISKTKEMTSLQTEIACGEPISLISVEGDRYDNSRTYRQPM